MVEFLPLIIAVSALVGGTIGWLFRQYWYRKELKRQAADDSSKVLKERKALLEEMISKVENPNNKNTLLAQIDEVNAALLGLYGKRLRNTLKEACLPPEEILISDGRSQHLEPQQAIRLRKIITELKTLPPSLSPRDLLFLGDAYYSLQRYEDAKDIYDKVLDLNPYDHVASRHRGATYIHMKRYEDAVADFDRSLKLKPDEPIALHDRGLALKKLKKYGEALDGYNRALGFKPNEPIILFSRGVTYAKLKRYKEALADFNRSLELRPDDPDAIYNLACLFSLWGKTNDALTYLEKAINLDEKWREDAKTDEDFDNIREDPRFKKLIKSD